MTRIDATGICVRRTDPRRRGQDWLPTESVTHTMGWSLVVSPYLSTILAAHTTEPHHHHLSNAAILCGSTFASLHPTQSSEVGLTRTRSFAFWDFPRFAHIPVWHGI